MKRFLLIPALTLLLWGCEDVVDVETPSQPPKLIVEAVLRVDLDEEFIPVIVRVSETSNFFEDIPVTELEFIQILTNVYDEDGRWQFTHYSSLYEEVPGSGEYVPDPNFSTEQRISTSLLDNPQVDFELHITHKGRRYFAFGEYVPSVPIGSLELGDRTLFDQDETEVVVRFTDAPDMENFYVFDFGFGNFLATEDTFYEGQEFFFSYFYDQSFPSGTELEVSLLGATESFYNYMDLLVEQSESVQGPFQTPIATVRGNVFDITGLDNIDISDNVGRPDDFPLGYFIVTQEFKATLTIP